MLIVGPIRNLIFSEEPQGELRVRVLRMVPEGA